MDNIQTLSTADTCAHATPARRLNKELWALRFTKKLQPMKMENPGLPKRFREFMMVESVCGALVILCVAMPFHLVLWNRAKPNQKPPRLLVVSTFSQPWN